MSRTIITQEIIEKATKLYLEDKLCFEKVGKILGIGTVTVWNIIKRQNIPIRSKLKLNLEQEQELIYLYQSGMSSMKLKDKFGLAQSVICDYLRRNNIKRKNMEDYKKYHFNEHFFDNPRDPSVLWLLGWMYSDGYVGSKGRMALVIHQHDSDIIYKMTKLINSDRPIFKTPKRPMIGMYFHSPYTKSVLEKLGCMQAKSLIIDYPNWFKENWEHQKFIQGEFEGDGCLHIKTKNFGLHCSISSGSEKFLIGLKNVLETRFNLQTKIRYKTLEPKKTSCLFILGGAAECVKFLDIIYENCGENYMNRKYNLYLKAKKMYQENLDREKNWKNIHSYKYFYFKSPEGQIYYGKGISQFCKEFNIKYHSIINVFQGRQNQYRGWIVPVEDEIELAKKNGSIINKFYFS